MRPKIRDVAEGVCSRFGVTIDELRGPSMSELLVIYRQAAMYLARDMTGQSYPKIGAYFGRYHGTILHGRNNMQSRINGCEVMARQISECKEAVYAVMLRRVVTERGYSEQLEAAE